MSPSLFLRAPAAQAWSRAHRRALGATASLVVAALVLTACGHQLAPEEMARVNAVTGATGQGGTGVAGPDDAGSGAVDVGGEVRDAPPRPERTPPSRAPRRPPPTTPRRRVTRRPGPTPRRAISRPPPRARAGTPRPAAPAPAPARGSRT